ncbi:MAG: TIM-barrel domain-containing protein [Oenococcus sp.]|uniref:glycoside hydrolase family 31 protein n=1 Tax=Oenococcus sp. TaxID=1979414 RepID=UPI0039EC3A45
MDKKIVGETYRFTVITDFLIRIEEDPLGHFEDRPTQTVVDRNFGHPKIDVIHNQNGHVLEIVTPGCHLYYNGGRFAPDTLFIDVAKAHSLFQNRWFFGVNNNNNLKGTARTLDSADGPIPLADGIMSKDGFSYLDDSESASYLSETDSYQTRPKGIIDGYFFAYGRDYQAALTDFYRLTGPVPLIPRFALGNWWSRYYPYTQAGYQRLMACFDEKKIPISVSVLDMDWHQVDVPRKYGSGWTGYTWNKSLFPQPEKLLTWLHEDGKKVSLNVHPAAGIRAFENCYPKVAKNLGLDAKKEEIADFDLENAKFRQSYFDDVHHPLEEQGVDFWWLDWQQGGSQTDQHLDPLWLLNHYHYQDSAKRHNGIGLTLSRYAGPGSHRYPLGFSGDTIISWASLNFQPYFTITAANIGYTWWSHDIGGHMHGHFDGELATRWLQFGVFSPINRLHSSNNLFSGKEPWNYRSDFQESQERFLRLRAQLLPYLDTANFKTHVQGVPLVKPLYYDYPEETQAYEQKNEYFFGSNMLVSPITAPHDTTTQDGHTTVWLPKGNWIDYLTHLPYQGDTVFNAYRGIDSLPVFVKRGSLIVTNPHVMDNPDHLPQTLLIQIFAGSDGYYCLVEHAGNQLAKTFFNWHDQEHKLSYTIEDPDHIIPKNRQIDEEVIVPKKEDVFTELFSRLQKAKIPFDLKQQLYQAFKSADFTALGYINLLNTLEDKDLKNTLTELVYVRQSYLNDI